MVKVLEGPYAQKVVCREKGGGAEHFEHEGSVPSYFVLILVYSRKSK